MVVMVGVVIAGAVVAARPLIKREILASSVGAGRSPSVGAMDAFVGTYRDPVEALEVLWGSGGVNQRDYVIEYLHRGFVPGSATWEEFRPWVEESVSFPDEDLRQNAFLLMEKNRDPAVVRLALPMLRDADPEARITALHALSAAGDVKYLGAVGPLLNDGEPSVRVVAAATVCKLADLEFSKGTTVEEKAGQWWGAHKDSFGKVSQGNAAVAEYPVAPEFHGVDLSGHVVNLNALRGKVVVLNFWATWCGSCVEELPTLQRVAEKHAGGGEDVVVIGVCIDTAPDDDGDAPDVTQAQVVQKIEALRKQNGVTYLMALDSDGRAMNAFGGESVPTSVLIDGSGRIRRRLTGVRSLAAWEGMIQEVR